MWYDTGVNSKSQNPSMKGQKTGGSIISYGGTDEPDETEDYTESSTKSGSKNVYTSSGRTSITDTMDAATRAAYTQLLATLQGGGTAAQRTATSALTAEMKNAQNQAASFSTEAAREQAQKSVALYNQQFQEGTLKTINASAEAAGLSGDAMAALLAQQGAVQVARQAADAELAAIVEYGNLSQGARGQAISAGTELANDPIVNQLLAALEIGEGSYTTVSESYYGQERSDYNEATYTSGTREKEDNTDSEENNYLNTLLSKFL